MRLELKDIKGGVLEQEYSLSVEEFPELAVLAENGAGNYLGPLHFTLRLQRTGRMVEVDGRLQATVQLECGRCLCRYQQEVDERFSFTFTPVLEEAGADQDEVELEADELGLVLYQDETLELGPCLQEQAVMALPVAHVCSSGCRGLCPECGVNLNEGSCDCSPKPFNNKFGALADLLSKKS